MAYPFTKIAIIYNPNSTGDSKDNATELATHLKKRLPKSIKVELIATQSAGHAEDLARELASGTQKVLLVSSSGDGGFNEVLNGLLAANNPNAAAIVLPSGNANDHHEATSERSVEEKIISPKVESVDAIKLTGMKDGATFERHAHSYIGAGLTAYIGKKLTEATLNPINEKLLVLKYLFLFKGVTLKVEPDVRWHRYSSVVFGNIGKMSKIIKLAPEADYDDGKMEVYEHKTNSTLKTVTMLVFGSMFGLSANAQLKQLSFISKHSIEAQFDGEVIVLDGNQPITVSVDRNAYKTLQ